MRDWLGTLVVSFLKAGPPVVRGRSLSVASTGTLGLTELSRADFAWAGASAVAAAVLFATTITTYPGLGDAPETIAGVTSLGILHAPGYPAYVLVAKAFTLLVPFGGEAFRVNLFSLVCAALSVAGVALLARRCGAARWASSLTALALATGVGFWFYADFAKHDMFSGLMFLVTLHLALAWLRAPRTRLMVGAGAAFAVGLGSSWPLMLLLVPTLAFVLLAGRHRLSLRSLAAATVTGLVLVVGVYGFVMVRASENPTLNWGDATTITRLYHLVNRADFSPPSNAAPSSAQTPSAAPGGSSGGNAGAGVIEPPGLLLTTALPNYAPIFARELGILALVLAGIGFLTTLRRRGPATWVLLITFVANLAGAAEIAGASTGGFDVDLIQEGFILGCFFVLATWAALGVTAIAQGLGQSEIGWRSNLVVHSWAVRLLAGTALAAALLVPPVISNASRVQRDSKPFADSFATSVFKEVPSHSVLVIWTAEGTQPLIYRQVVFHQRRDVDVVAASGLTNSWYRQEISRRFGLPVPPLIGDQVIEAREFVKSLLGVRPVYLDPYTAQLLGGQILSAKSQPDTIGYQPVGIVDKATSGKGPVTITNPPALDAAVRHSEVAAGMPDPNWFVWPNVYIGTSVYLTAGLEVARAYAENQDSVGLHEALLNQLSIDPQDTVAKADLQQFEKSQGAG